MLKFSCEKALLQAAADTLLSPDLQADIRSELAAGITYAAARQQAHRAQVDLLVPLFGVVRRAA